MTIKSTALTAPVFRPERFDAGNPPPAELSEFIRPVGSATDAITSGGEAGAPNPQTSVFSILSKEK